jgi:mutator family transposase/PH (Pleckstrin Homology) domain-containing protein
VLIGGVVLAVRTLRAEVRVEQHGLLLRGMLRTRRLPWHDVAGAEVQPTNDLGLFYVVAGWTTPKPKCSPSVPFPELTGPRCGARTRSSGSTRKSFKRRARVVGIFPNEASVIRLVGAVLADMHDEWQAGDRRYLSEASMALLYPERETVHVAEITRGD